MIIMSLYKLFKALLFPIAIDTERNYVIDGLVHVLKHDVALASIPVRLIT